MDLFDKYKKRKALITEDYKSLIVIYEFRSRAVAFNKEQLIEKRKNFLRGEIYVALRENKFFELQVKLENPDLRYLYQIFIIVAYILGRNIDLEYFLKDFPYYPVTRQFDLRSDSPASSKIFYQLLSSPGETIASLHSKLMDKASYFSKLVPGMMEVNAFPYQEVIFVFEYGLLQGLSKHEDISGNIFTREDELGELERFSDAAKKLLNNGEYKRICGHNLEEKLKPDKLNSKGVTKEKIRSFLVGFEYKRVRSYEKYVDEWNKYRNKNTIVAHGVKPLRIDKEEVSQAVSSLHSLLLDIVKCELSKDSFGG